MVAPGPTSKSKTGLGGFPGRIKDFVHDMKGFRKDIHRHRRGVKSEQVRLKQLLPSEDAISTSQAASVSDRRSLFQSTPHVRSLSIRVTVNFGEPLNYSYSQDYEASSSLQPSEELCEGLLHRVDHCSKELITRKDSSALDRTATDGLAKPLRYEIQVQILRNDIGTGTEAWASRTVRSYQRQPLGTEAAREIILSTHHMVGLFLRHHDEAFVWKDGPVREDPSQEEKTFPYRPGRVQPLTSIPRSNFIEKQQDFESIPGYTVSFSFTSQNHHRLSPHWHETVEVNSHQLSPLTLASAESLFFDACYAVDGVFRSERKGFEAQHKSCANHNACRHCRPHDGDGIEMLLSVKNNIGPLFDTLERTTCASVNVFWRDHAQDCIEFVERAKAAIVQVCREADESVSQINDFEFYIIELRGRGWIIDQPLVFTLGPETSLSRRTIEALLDRLQTGVADILRGNAIAVRMTARKRGHSILDKTLVAREPIEKLGNKRKSPEKSKAYVLDRLRRRIECDIEMVCKDTCSIVHRDVETKVDSALSTGDRPSMNIILASSRRSSDPPTPSKKPVNDRQHSLAGILDSEGSELLETPEPFSASSSISLPQWTRVTRDPETGLRLFPLVPQTAQGSHKLSPVDSPFEVSISSEKSNTPLTQIASDSGISNREPESAEVSLTDSRNYERERYTTEGSSISTRPQTPSLEFGGGSPSIRSSLLITPKIHEPVLNIEVEILQGSTPDAESGEGKGTDRADNYTKRLFMPRSVSSPTTRLYSRDVAISSPIRQARPVQEEEYLNSLGSEGVTPNERISKPEHRAVTEEEQTSNNETPATAELAGDYPTAESSTGRCESAVEEDASCSEIEDFSLSKLEYQGKSKSTSTIKLISNTPLVEPETEQDTPTKEEDLPAPAPEVETEAFSQSKPDFDFSSPQTATTPEGSNATDEASPPAVEKSDKYSKQQLDQDKYLSPDPSDGEDDVEINPVRPGLAALPQHRKSFGSAGYLGSFHEQRFYGMGLRRALMGTSTPPPRPFSPAGEREGQKQREYERPGTAM
ncbi:hypothetical protein HD806DRAFT_481139 [Xylariaceae sp. AK1471]|nr:hypothetical protein HD806DRAFT_481139 [Xylariaceae sp. AK1471]